MKAERSVKDAQIARDVIEVEFASPQRVRVLSRNLSPRNAEAYIDMAVMRRGVDRTFFTDAPAGRYKDGDRYLHPETTP